jgi:thioredoxin 1
MEDPEIEKIKQRKLEEMLRRQQDAAAQAQAEVLELSSADFDTAISSHNLVLVDFWAEWCGPCRMMHPVFSRMAKKYKHIKFARLNIDHSQDIAMRFGVQSIPTFIMFRGGRPVDKMIGAVGEPGIHMIAQKYHM